jgi:uncharacterized SAM-dependent methyltransferase
MPPSVPTEAAASPRAELLAGLNAALPAIAPKFLYDALGSKLFEAICELPEYYPTRTEAGILARHARAIAAACGPGATLIDLGAGNCAKAAGLFPALRPRRYVAVDIARDFLAESVERLRRRFEGIDMQALALDFGAGLRLPASVERRRRLFFYPAPRSATSRRRRRWISWPACTRSATSMAPCCWAWTWPRTRACCTGPMTMHWA